MIYGLRSVEVFGVSGDSLLSVLSPRIALGGGAARVGFYRSSSSFGWGALFQVFCCQVLRCSSRVRLVSFSVLASALRFGLVFPAQGLTLRSSGTAQKRAAPHFYVSSHHPSHISK